MFHVKHQFYWEVNKMRKSKSLLKTSAIAMAVLHGINTFIDSSTVSNVKTGGKYYHWKHGDIYYKVQGQGKPVLLVHDLTVFSSMHEWSKIVNSLALTNTVYCLDLIGCGKSDKPEIIYTNYYYVQMIHDFVTDVIGARTKVITSGFSSTFVIMANSIHNTLFEDIVMINPPSLSSLKKAPDDRSKIMIKLFNLPVIGRTAYYIAVNKQNTEYYLTEKCFYNPFNLKPPVTKASYDAAHQGKGSGKMLLASLNGYYMNIDITKAINNCKNNVTIIMSENCDNAENIIQNYKKENTSIAVHKVEKSKLLPHLESPEKIIDMLK